MSREEHKPTKSTGDIADIVCPKCGWKMETGIRPKNVADV